MTKLLYTIMLCSVLAITACDTKSTLQAAQKVSDEPVVIGSEEPTLITPENIAETTSEITSIFAKANGWCDKKASDAAEGSIVVEWSYDKDGKCTLQSVRQVKSKDGSNEPQKETATP